MSDSQHGQPEGGAGNQNLQGDSSTSTAPKAQATWQQQQQQLRHMDDPGSGAQAPDASLERPAPRRGRGRQAGQRQLSWQAREPALNIPSGQHAPHQRHLTWQQRELYAEQQGPARAQA